MYKYVLVSLVAIVAVVAIVALVAERDVAGQAVLTSSSCSTCESLTRTTISSVLNMCSSQVGESCSADVNIYGKYVSVTGLSSTCRECYNQHKDYIINDHQFCYSNLCTLTRDDAFRQFATDNVGAGEESNVDSPRG